MAEEAPKNYFEWQKQVITEAQIELDETLESVLKHYIAKPFAIEGLARELPEWVREFLEEMGVEFGEGEEGEMPEHFVWAHMLKQFGLSLVSGIFGALLFSIINPLKYFVNRKTTTVLPDINIAAEAYRRGDITRDTLDHIRRSMGFSDDYENVVRWTTGPYPEIGQLFNWLRYFRGFRAPEEIIDSYYKLDRKTLEIFNDLSRPRFETGEIHQLLHRDVIGEGKARDYYQRIGWRNEDLDWVNELSWITPPAEALFVGQLVHTADFDQAKDILQHGDINPRYRDIYASAIATKPSPWEYLQYHLRVRPDDEVDDGALIRLGVHPWFTYLYKELAYQMPGVSDLIRMAVREVFSPEIATKFGLFEDYPSIFEHYAKMVGLRPEWARRYWAAHWELPSPQMGFEMFHRRIIDYDTLVMLLRALDVMPFWRDKLIKLAYMPLTRVDVRRMYAVGVLDEKDVYNAYLDLGYSPENAQRMTEFTIRYTEPKEKDLTVSQVIKAFKIGLLDFPSALNYLTRLNMTPNAAMLRLQMAQYELWESTVDEQIKLLKTKWQRGLIDDTILMQQMYKLGLSTERVSYILDSLYAQKESKPPRLLTLAQTEHAYKAGYMSEKRTRQELRWMGYDDERIDILLELWR